MPILHLLVCSSLLYHILNHVAELVADRSYFRVHFLGKWFLGPCLSSQMLIGPGPAGSAQKQGPKLFTEVSEWVSLARQPDSADYTTVRIGPCLPHDILWGQFESDFMFGED